MDVPDKFTQVGFLLAENRFVAVLKQMTVSTVAAVERNSISGQQSPHDGGNRCQACF